MRARAIAACGVAAGVGYLTTTPLADESPDCPAVAESTAISPDRPGREFRTTQSQSRSASAIDLQVEARSTPIDFPDHVHPTLLPEAVAETFTTQLPDGYRLLELHCDEYPCIGVVACNASYPFQQVESDLRASLGVAAAPLWIVGDPFAEGERHVDGVAIPMVDVLDDVLVARTEVRLETLSRRAFQKESAP